MKHSEIKAMIAALAPVIKQYTSDTIGPLSKRLNDLERRFSVLETKSTLSDSADVIAEKVVAALKAAPPAAKGRRT